MQSHSYLLHYTNTNTKIRKLKTEINSNIRLKAIKVLLIYIKGTHLSLYICIGLCVWLSCEVHTVNAQSVIFCKAKRFYSQRTTTEVMSRFDNKAPKERHVNKIREKKSLNSYTLTIDTINIQYRIKIDSIQWLWHRILNVESIALSFQSFTIFQKLVFSPDVTVFIFLVCRCANAIYRCRYSVCTTLQATCA